MHSYFLTKANQLAYMLLKAALTMLGVLLLVFFLMRFAPGDPASSLLGDMATNEDLAAMRDHLGLSASFVVQLFDYLGRAVVGDFGTSLVYRQPVTAVILAAIPNTILLGSVASVLAIVLAFPLGIASAVWRGSSADRVINGIVLIAQVVPPFWAAVMLIHIFSLQLQILPTSGTGSWKNLVLPAVTLAIFQLPILVRTLRSTMVGVLNEDYIRTARAKGVERWRIILVHALRNALGPVVIVIGLQAGSLLSGAIITEAVFAWPGIGSIALGSLMSRDYALAQAVIAFTALLVVAFNLLADMVVSLVDPRLRKA